MKTNDTAFRRGAFLAYGLVVAVFLFLYLRGYIYSFSELVDPYNISIYAGVVAYVVFLTQFLLSARIRWIERLLGQDLLLRAHGFLGIAVFGAIAVHGVIKIAMIGPSPQSLLGVLAALTYIVLAPAAIFVLQGRAKKKLESPRFERTKTRHNLFVLAAILAVVHVQLASSTYSLVLRTVTLAWAALCLGAYVNHKYLRPRKLHTLTVESVEKRGGDVVAITLSSVGENGENFFPRRAGQFAYFRFHSDAVGPEEHPFTISSASDEKVQIIARQSGDYTNQLAEIRPGNTATVEGPYGRFFADTSKHRPLYLIAGGIGITPMLSMAADREVRASRPVSLIWSTRTGEDLSLIPELDALRGDIRLQTVFTRSGDGGKRIGADTMDELIPHDDQKTADFYVCGPAGFIDTVSRALRGRVTSRRQIHYEKFSWQ